MQVAALVFWGLPPSSSYTDFHAFPCTQPSYPPNLATFSKNACKSTEMKWSFEPHIDKVAVIFGSIHMVLYYQDMYLLCLNPSMGGRSIGVLRRSINEISFLKKSCSSFVLFWLNNCNKSFFTPFRDIYNIKNVMMSIYLRQWIIEIW